MTRHLPMIKRTEIKVLSDIGSIRHGDHVLKNGAKSDIIVDLHGLASHPSIFRYLAEKVSSIVWDLGIDRVVGVPYAGIPLATALSLMTDIPMLWVRKSADSPGKPTGVEGDFARASVACVVEDLVTTGASAIETAGQLRDAGMIVNDVVTVADMEQGARENLASDGLKLHALVTLNEIRRYGRPEPVGPITREE